MLELELGRLAAASSSMLTYPHVGEMCFGVQERGSRGGWMYEYSNLLVTLFTPLAVHQSGNGMTDMLHCKTRMVMAVAMAMAMAME